MSNPPLRTGLSPGPQLINGERIVGRPTLRAPSTVDLSLTGLCQMRCAWCWGTAHSIRGDQHSAEQWIKVIDKLARRGTRHVVITGGEPFLSPSLEPVTRAAHTRGLRVTLSTNGIRLSKEPETRSILNFVDDLGIPVDGHTPSVNATMRERSGYLGGWDHAVEALKIGQTMVATVTVRTVVAKKNVSSVPKIPGALRARGVDPDALRFKLYQVEPIGPHFASADWSDWAIDSDAVLRVANRMAGRHPTLKITVQLYGGTSGRYFRVDPDGRTFGTDMDDDRPIEVPYGNIVDDLDGVLASWREHKRMLRERGSMFDAKS